MGSGEAADQPYPLHDCTTSIIRANTRGNGEQQMPANLVTVDHVSKKFCRNLRRSLWYGFKDIGTELMGRQRGHSQLRKGEFWCLSDVSLEVERGDTIGLIGPNGAGKTTLLRMLNGLIKPDAGRIEIRGRMQALIALGAGFSPILTGRENIYVNGSVLGITTAEIKRLFDGIVEFSGIEDFIDAPVQTYSSGMAVRLGFAIAAHLNPDILLVDEVLAVGDEGFQRKCLTKIGELKNSGTAIILVSHNMHTIATFADDVVLMDGGRHNRFDDVAEGIREYRALFVGEQDADIQEVCTGNDDIRFFDVEISNRELRPGDSFSIAMRYESGLHYAGAEADLAIYSGAESGLYFQASNKAHQKDLTLEKGSHELRIEIKDIPLADALGTVVIAIWSKNRNELLFWWRIPVRFMDIPHSTGRNFLCVEYSQDGQ
jgi:ABC-type polysaccharide/polyol phosphate transport system ATPase subunit